MNTELERVRLAYKRDARRASNRGCHISKLLFDIKDGIDHQHTRQVQNLLPMKTHPRFISASLYHDQLNHT